MRKLAALSGMAMGLLFLVGPLLLSLIPEFYINTQYSGSILNFPWEGFPLSLFAVLIFLLSLLLSFSLLCLCLRSRRKGIQRARMCLGHLAVILGLYGFALNSLRSDDVNYRMISREGERVDGAEFRLVAIEPEGRAGPYIRNVRVDINVNDTLNLSLGYGRSLAFAGRRYFLVDFGNIVGGVRLSFGDSTVTLHIGEVKKCGDVKVGLISIEFPDSVPVARLSVDGIEARLRRGAVLEPQGILFEGLEKVQVVVLKSARNYSVKPYLLAGILMALSLVPYPLRRNDRVDSSL